MCNKEANKHKNPQIIMIIRAMRLIQARLKRKKNHMIVIFIYLDTVNNYFIQHVNTRGTAHDTTISKMKDIIEA